MPSFTQVLNLSISASFLVLAVAPLRLVLRKAPKAFRCALWALVAFRLLCPVSFESELSLIPSREVIPQEYLTMEPDRSEAPARLEIVTNPRYESQVTVDTDTTVDRVQSLDVLGTVIWLTGMGAMGLYALYSYLSLRLRVRMAGWVRENVYECDELDSPFILGILRPRIYLPSGLDEITKSHVLAHEKAHLKRLDHLWKPLGFALLTVHWFNPVMWLAYVLLCRDIELACDERVIRKLDKGAVRAYSEALVRCSVNHRMIAACPLAFGEVGVSGRIKSMLSYKKPGFWVLLTAVIAGIALAVCFLTDPAPDPVTIGQILDQDGVRIIHSREMELELTLNKLLFPENVLNGREHFFEPGDIPLQGSEHDGMYVSAARMSGDELLMEVEFVHTPEKTDFLLLPYDPLDDSPGREVCVKSPEAALIRGKGRTGFSLCIKSDVWRMAPDEVHVVLGGIYSVSYMSEDAPIAQIYGREYRVEEVLYGRALYPDPEDFDRVTTGITVCTDSWGEVCITSAPNDEYFKFYSSLYDSHCTLIETSLTEKTFDDHFADGDWISDDLSRTLRRNNLAAWRIVPAYLMTDIDSHLLLQKDGSVYLACGADSAQHFAALYRLTTEPAPPAEETAPSSAIITTTFYHPSGMNTFTSPYFYLSSDGYFHLSESPLSSYFAHGPYTQTDTELILKTGDDRYTWYFIADGGGYRFDADRSSPITTCFDLKNPEPLPDGTLFLPSDSQKRAAAGLDLAIQATIEHFCKTEGDEQYLITECHSILDAAVISGTPPVGSTEHEELVTVHAVGLVRRYTVRGTAYRFESEQLVHAVMTFLVDETSYTLQELKTSEDIPLSDLYSPRAMELWMEYESQVEQLESQCDWEAQLWVEQNPPSENEVWHLIEVICSSPAWSSNPGDYIAAHQQEYQRLLQCERTTVAYCFDQFSSRRQIGLEGHIMALACQAIIGETEGLCIDSHYMTGQDWFDLFVKEARTLRDEIGAEELGKLHPYHAMALEAMGI